MYNVLGANVTFIHSSFVVHSQDIFTIMETSLVDHDTKTTLIFLTKEYEILRSPGSGASLLKTSQVYNYCAMRGICLLNRAISPTFLPLCPEHSRFHLELGRKCIIRFSRKRKINENLENNREIFAKITKFLQKFCLFNFRENIKPIFAKGEIFAFSWAFFAKN
jgi:hypothetical protein